MQYVSESRRQVLRVLVDVKHGDADTFNNDYSEKISFNIWHYVADWVLIKKYLTVRFVIGNLTKWLTMTLTVTYIICELAMKLLAELSSWAPIS